MFALSLQSRHILVEALYVSKIRISSSPSKAVNLIVNHDRLFGLSVAESERLSPHLGSSDSFQRELYNTVYTKEGNL